MGDMTKVRHVPGLRESRPQTPDEHRAHVAACRGNAGGASGDAIGDKRAARAVRRAHFGNIFAGRRTQPLDGPVVTHSAPRPGSSSGREQGIVAASGRAAVAARCAFIRGRARGNPSGSRFRWNTFVGRAPENYRP
eukprot:4663617-Pyramimonas_sp.AAC.1